MSPVDRFYRWAAPTMPTADDDTLAEVDRTLFSQAMHLGEVLVPMAPLTAVAWIALLWTRADHTGLLLWFALISAVSLAMYQATSRHRHASIETATRRLGNVYIGSGVVWGMLPLLAMSPTDRWHPVAGMMVITAMVANIIFAAAIPRLFWSFHAALAVVASGALLARAGGDATIVVMIIAYITPLAALLAGVSRMTDQRAAFFAVTSRRNADELRKLNEILEYRANHDSLTGVANRQEFTRRLDEVSTAGNTGAVGVLYMDIDRFKRINDTLGHAGGDELLQAAAERITNRIRPGDLVARLGGDEFTVLVGPGCTPGELATVARRILEAFDEPFMIQGEHHQVGLSIGSRFSDGDVTATDLLRGADAALYAAKDAGRGQIRSFDNTQRSWSEDR